MASTWETMTVTLRGGLILNLEPVQQSETMPGSLIMGQNYEASLQGGYTRIKGYQKYSSTILPGTGNVLGSFVFNSGVVACRGTGVYFGTGTAWTSIAPSTRTSAGKYRATKYNWSQNAIIIADGVNYPMRYKANGTATNITDSNVTGASVVCEHQHHIFYGVGQTLVFSTPTDETDFTVASGAGSIAIGYAITQIASYRDDLYVFTANRIARITGTSSANFALEWITRDLGCAYPDTIKEMAGDLYFLAVDGIRTIASTVRINDVNLDAVTGPVYPIIRTWTSGYTTDQISACVIPSKVQYRLFRAGGTATGDDTTSDGIIFCLTRHTPEFFTIKGITAICADGTYQTSGTELVIHGGTNGYVYQEETTDAFDGGNVASILQIPFLTFDDPAISKILYRLRAYVVSDGLADLTANLILDDGNATIIQPASIDLTQNQPAAMFVYGWPASKYGSITYGLGPNINYVSDLSGSGLNASIKLTTNDTFPAFTIKQLIIEYDLGDRQ